MKNKKNSVRSILYSLLFGILIIKIAVLFILFNVDQAETTLPILETSKAYAQENEKIEDKKTETNFSFDKLEKKSDFFTKPENSFLETEVLQREREKINRERQLVDNERQQLEELKKEINAKLERLTQVQKEVQKKIEEQKALIIEKKNVEKENGEKHFQHLLKIYSSMPSKKSAALISNLDMDITIKLLSQMKGENVGQILGYIKPEKAARISERLANASVFKDK